MSLKVPSERIDEYLAGIDSMLEEWENAKVEHDLNESIIALGNEIMAPVYAEQDRRIAERKARRVQEKAQASA